MNKIILPEDEYISKLTSIIQHDYYPALKQQHQEQQYQQRNLHDGNKEQNDIPKDIISYKKVDNVTVVEYNNNNSINSTVLENIKTINDFHTLITSEDNIEFEINSNNDEMKKSIKMEQLYTTSQNNDNIRKDDALPLLASDEFASEYLLNDDIDKKKEVAHLKNNLYFIPDEQQHKNHLQKQEQGSSNYNDGTSASTNNSTLKINQEENDKLLMPPPSKQYNKRNIEPSQTRFPNQSSFPNNNNTSSSSSCNMSSTSSISSCHYSLSSSSTSSTFATNSIFTTNSSFSIATTNTMSKANSRIKKKKNMDKKINKKINVRSSSSLASALRQSYTTPLRRKENTTSSVSKSSISSRCYENSTPTLHRKKKVTKTK